MTLTTVPANMSSFQPVAKHEPHMATPAPKRRPASFCRRPTGALNWSEPLMLKSFRPAPINPSLEDDHVPALAPVLSPRGPVPAEIDAQLGTLGRRAANGNCAARNALYAAFAPRIDYLVHRAQVSSCRYDVDMALEAEDIAQQAFVVFADLLSAWNGQGSLSAYIFSHFPWRLSSAIREMSDPRPRRSLSSMRTDILTDGTFVGEEALALLDVMAAELSERDGKILIRRIRDRHSWAEIAREIGIDKRSAMRDWKRILASLRESLRPLT